MTSSMLKHMILHKLADRPRAGYGLCKEIEMCTGYKPSYGSIYPLLEKLTQEKLVTVKEEGRKKIYTLTKNGKKQVTDIDHKREELIDNLSTQIKLLMELTGQNPEPMLALLERLRKGQPPVGPLTNNMIKFRDNVFRMVQDGRAERNKKEMNAMLKEMLVKLEQFK